MHSSHRTAYEIIVRLLGIAPGETVVEVGCGTGSLAHHFVADGYDYWGFDPNVERIAFAQEHIQSGHFLVGDALALTSMNLPDSRYFFAHSVLHHLRDAQCQQIIGDLLARRRDVVLVVSEPLYPSPWWTNPLSALCALLDRGDFVRTGQNWRHLFGPHLDVITTRHLWPRWPVSILDARLVARSFKTAADDAVVYNWPM